MNNLLNQIRTLHNFQAALYILSLIALSATALTSIYLDIPMYKFMRDPNSIMKVSPFMGIISNFGVLLWCASAVVCLFSRTILIRRIYDNDFSLFILCSGLMTILLLMDDLFMLHEYIFPRLFGLSEKPVTISYGALILFGLIKFKKCILETEFFILLVAIGFFGLSLIVDSFQYAIEPLVGQWRILLEDGFKLLGIVSWFGYFFKSCLHRIWKEL
jgi:hypothetical protein